MSAGKVFFGGIMALAIGAVLGVLYAPDKGSNTRKKLKKQGSRYLNAAKDTAGEYVATIEETFESAKDNAVGLADRVKGAVDSLTGNEPQKHARKA